MTIERDMKIYKAFQSDQNFTYLRGLDYWNELFKIYSPYFSDTSDNLVIIDEIQESPDLYNSIRDLMTYRFHVLISGSYLGITEVNKKFFDPSDDLHRIAVTPLTFEEYLKNIGEYDNYMKLDLFGASCNDEYENIQSHYEAYSIIGGYPIAVKQYLSDRNLSLVYERQKRIYDTIIEECQHYLPRIEADVFRQVAGGVARYMAREKVGKFIDYKEFINSSGLFSYKNAKAAILWFVKCRILGFCDRAYECDITVRQPQSRVYYMDMGIATHCYNAAKINPIEAKGLKAENFVYLSLDRLDPYNGPSHEVPVFGTYKGGEIDFLMASSSKTFAIDVKSGSEGSRTAMKLLEDKIVDYVLYARSNCKGSRDGNVMNIPIYLIERFDFDRAY
jgi:predicted AAA+ superfamily ATPase